MRRRPRPGSGHRTLPHTADVIVEAWAPTPEECVAQAVAGLVGSFADVSAASGATTHSFSTSVTSLPAALVVVLEEALYVLDMRGQVPTETSVTEIGGSAVAASFRLVDVSDEQLHGSVPKGISLSGLAFGRVAGSWRCRVTVDV
jgi:SHS2 domain-containing protein